MVGKALTSLLASCENKDERTRPGPIYGVVVQNKGVKHGYLGLSRLRRVLIWLWIRSTAWIVVLRNRIHTYKSTAFYLALNAWIAVAIMEGCSNNVNQM